MLHHAWYKATEFAFNESTPAEIATLARRHPNVNIIMAHLAGGGWRGVRDFAIARTSWSIPRGRNHMPVWSSIRRPIGRGPGRIRLGFGDSRLCSATGACRWREPDQRAAVFWAERWSDCSRRRWEAHDDPVRCQHLDRGCGHSRRARPFRWRISSRRCGGRTFPALLFRRSRPCWRLNHRRPISR